jgi:hypothetical protein
MNPSPSFLSGLQGGADLPIRGHFSPARGQESRDAARIDLIQLGYNGMSGTAKHVFPQWTASPSYLRPEAAANVDLSTVESRRIMNPIWIVVQG